MALTAGCAGPKPAPAPPPAPAFDYGAHVGVALRKAGRTCLGIRNAGLKAGERIRLVTATAPPEIADAEIAGDAAQPCPVAGTDVTGAPDTTGLRSYELKLLSGSLPSGAPAFALAGVPAALTAGEAGVTGDLDGDGRPESLRSCTSAEGVHLSVWAGPPPTGKRRWHHYFHLGYDVTPDCTEADTRPDAP